MHVEVVYALPERQHCLHLELPQGATVGQALDAVRRIPPFDALALQEVPVGIFGRPATRETVLEANDRVEVYRPLRVDPRESRRQRARNQPGSSGNDASG
ncbi:MAG TPA: RnfH family protein [Pseudomonadales bacterium]